MSNVKGRVSLQLWDLVRSYLWTDRDEIEEDIENADHARYHPGRAPMRHFYTEMRRQNAAIAITILSVAFLESYINELIDLEPSLSLTERKNLQDLRLRDKYFALASRLNGQAVWRSDDPFNSFELLVGVRNALVHHTPRRRIRISQLKERLNVFWQASGSVDDLGNAEYANWVFTTVESLVKTINGLITKAEICLDTEEELFWVSERWNEEDAGA